MYHRARPARRIEKLKRCGRIHPVQVMAEHGAFELRVIGAFHDLVIRECCENVRRELFARSEVYDLHRLVVPRIREEQHLAVLGVFVPPDLLNVEITVSLYVNG